MSVVRLGIVCSVRCGAGSGDKEESGRPKHTIGIASIRLRQSVVIVHPARIVFSAYDSLSYRIANSQEERKKLSLSVVIINYCWLFPCACALLACWLAHHRRPLIFLGECNLIFVSNDSSFESWILSYLYARLWSCSSIWVILCSADTYFRVVQ